MEIVGGEGFRGLLCCCSVWGWEGVLNKIESTSNYSCKSGEGREEL